LFRKTFSSWTQFGTSMRKTLKAIQTKVGYRLLDELLDFIFEEVYLSSLNGLGNSQNEFYERTADLISIWDVVKVDARSRASGGAEQQVYVSIQPINSGELTHNTEKYQHISPHMDEYEEGEGKNKKTTYKSRGANTKGQRKPLDAYEFAKLINDGIPSAEDSMFGVIRPRPYWDKFLKWANENYKRIFEEEFYKYMNENKLDGELGTGYGYMTQGNQNNGSTEGSWIVKYK